MIAGKVRRGLLFGLMLWMLGTAVLVNAALQATQFDELPLQEFGNGWDQMHLRFGDTDGDGRSDLIWSSAPTFLINTPNYVYTALANGSGELNLQPLQTMNGNWIGFTPLVGRFNDDNKDDIAWVSLCQAANCIPAKNLVRVGLSDGGGQFTMVQEQDIFNTLGWSSYLSRAADIDGDGLTDLVFNYVGQGLIDGVNRVQTALSNGDGTFAPQPFQTIGQDGWNYFNMTIGDVNGDGRSDLIWTTICLLRPLAIDGKCWQVPEANIATGLSNGDGTFTVFAPQVLNDPLPGDMWRAVTGDFDGDGRVDLVLLAVDSADVNTIILARGRADGRFDIGSRHEFQAGGYYSEPFALDVDDDGRDELLFNSICQAYEQQNCIVSHNYIYVADYAGGDDFVLGPRLELGGNLYNQHIGSRHAQADYNGDGAQDLLWSTTNYRGSGNLNVVFIALAHAQDEPRALLPIITAAP